ncbi:hypothetical protein RCL_jg28348.t1 [Rhizophagus clarus]|uniref:Uncharacterized protein n=1 Tax=Rhizophagus clarus TaxID=94130 RepID=A0A8H3LU31_9GLOM|nr:hypothetical protein RCL_jg28348.t1 [Rhizophagus clarus]
MLSTCSIDMLKYSNFTGNFKTNLCGIIHVLELYCIYHGIIGPSNASNENEILTKLQECLWVSHWVHIRLLIQSKLVKVKFVMVKTKLEPIVHYNEP